MCLSTHRPAMATIRTFFVQRVTISSTPRTSCRAEEDILSIFSNSVSQSIRMVSQKCSYYLFGNNLAKDSKRDTGLTLAK